MVSPLGASAATSFSNLCSDAIGIVPLSSQYPDSVALPAKLAGLLPTDFDISFWHRKLSIVKNHYSALSLAVATAALEDSALTINEQNNETVGLIYGTDRSSTVDLRNAHRAVLQHGYDRLDRFIIPKILASQAIGTISIAFGIKGFSSSISAGFTTGSIAIRDAYRCIQRQEAVAVLAGASEVDFDPALLMSLYKSGVLSRRNVPEEACKPFDELRDGIVYSEGAAAVVVETLEHALKRKARIYCEIASTASGADTENWGEGVLRIMKKCAEFEPDLILGDAPGFRNCDADEANAIEKVAPNALVTSIKGRLGHMLAASGAANVVVGALALYEGKVPGILGLQRPVNKKLKFCTETVKKKCKGAIVNAYALDGTSFSSIALKSYKRAK